MRPYVLWALHRLLPASLRHPVWWLAPTVAFAVFLYVRSRRWTGGPGFRGRVRADLAGGVAACHLVRAVDAVEFEEREDEGPVFFVPLRQARRSLLGQYLARYKSKGFPWREFEVMEAPNSKVFFGFKAIGERLEPSAKHPPLPWDAYKQLLSGAREYAIVNVAFEEPQRGSHHIIRTVARRWDRGSPPSAPGSTRRRSPPRPRRRTRSRSRKA